MTAKCEDDVEGTLLLPHIIYLSNLYSQPRHKVWTIGSLGLDIHGRIFVIFLNCERFPSLILHRHTNTSQGV